MSDGDLHAAFDELLDTVRRVATDVRQCAPEIQADGYRNLLGMLAATIRRVARADPDRPRFVTLADDFSRGAFSNPDSHVFAADIDGDACYRVVGHRGACVDLSFELLDGLAGYESKPVRSLGYLDLAGIDVDADGRFELWLGGAARARNWLPNPAEARVLFARQTLDDWSAGPPPPPLIERIGPHEVGVRERTAAAEAQRLLQTTAQQLEARSRASAAFAAAWRANLPVNQLPAPQTRGAGYLPGQYSTQCRYRIAAGNALIIEIEPTSARYSSICLGNEFWFESFDIRATQCSLTGMQVRASSDGVVRYVISLTDPGVPNWLDPSGHETGVVFMRWQGVAGPAPNRPQTVVVPTGEIRKQFPIDEPFIDSHERSRQRRLRCETVDRRFP